MNSLFKQDLYLAQSRRLAKIVRNTIGVKSHWTNYSAWEYHYNNIRIEVRYVPGYQDEKRIEIYHYPKGNYESLLKTDSIKEAITYLKSL